MNFDAMIRLGALDESHVEAHNAGEDEETVRWLSGAPATSESTRSYFAFLARNAAQDLGKRGFGVWLDDRLAGYIDFELDADDVPEPGDVNLAYAVHPWARRRGVAAAAVTLVCALLVERGIGRRAVIRTEVENAASAAAAKCCGFTRLDTRPDHGDAGGPEFQVWVRQLTD